MYFCQECGYKSVKWMGKCPHCAGWETFVETHKPHKEGRYIELSENTAPQLLSEVAQDSFDRITCGMGEFDHILGGGLVPGEVVLVGGQPGIGKSTLLLQVAGVLSGQKRVLYVNVEESSFQVKMRASRLGVDCSNIYLLSQDNLLEVYRFIQEAKFEIVIIDSIQVVFHPEIEAPRGTLSQIRGCAEFLTRIAKSRGIGFFIVGHVTKEGVIAGPKMLEHIVDCVLYFEPESDSHYRILRASKNRFGATGEIAVFEMTSRGLHDVAILSDIFLPHKDHPVAGSCISCVMEGQKPILIELQSLVSRAGFGVVRRRSLGYDFNRFSLLIATIEKRLKISFSSQDIFVNIAGGIRISDPAADCAVVIAILSSFKDKEVPASTVFIGEVGLAGELRPVSNIMLRLKEAVKGGFQRCYIPQRNSKEITKLKGQYELIPISSLKELGNILQ